MPFNGSGIYSLVYSWLTDAANGIKIRADRMMTQETDIAQALTNCITRDGQSTPTANLPMGGYKHTNVLNAANRNEYATLGQIQDGGSNWVTASGTADAITAFYNPPIATLVDGQLFYIRATAANATTTPTFSPDSLTARVITKFGGSALSAGDIKAAGHELILRYNLASTRYELLDPANQFTGGNLSSAINWAKSADIASAATTDLATSTGNYVTITGTTTITALGTLQAGSVRILRFTGILTLTHNASSLILPTGANITTAAGDIAIFVSEGSGNWRCVDYQRSDGSVIQTGYLKTSNYMYVRDEKTSGTAPQNLVVGTLTRTLNTTVINTITGASLASSQITLPAGSYYINAQAPAVATGGTKARLYNVTDATYALEGVAGNLFVGNVNSYNSTIKGIITITSTKVFELRHYASAVNTGGTPVSQGAEVYSEVEIWKTA